MNLYDFDGTIYDGDSTIDFFLYCFKTRPKIIISMPALLKGAVLHALGFCDKTYFKQCFLSFLKHIPDIDRTVVSFWEKNSDKIKAWYLCQKESTDIIISASPEFLLAPVCSNLNVSLIASEFDKKTGVCSGNNCRGAEKIKRLKQVIDISEVSAFYSDSQADAPLAELVENSYLVRGEVISPWNKKGFKNGRKNK